MAMLKFKSAEDGITIARHIVSAEADNIQRAASLIQVSLSKLRESDGGDASDNIEYLVQRLYDHATTLWDLGESMGRLLPQK